MNTARIVFIGAGSMSFGISMFRDIFSSRELRGSTLALVDVDAEYLQRMAALATRMNEQTGAGLIIESTTDRRQALPGAQFVVNSIAIDRSRLWKLDFEVPRKYGIRHTLGENGGPGALFFTLRTIPAILDIVRDMEELCPQAWFLNFSNPESRIILALSMYSRIKAIGLCHGVFMSQHDVARILGLPDDDVDVWAAGMNHFQWLLRIRQRSSGADLYPTLREKERGYDPLFVPLTRKMFRAFGLWVTCSDDHMGEYLPYGWEAGEEGYDFEQDARNREQLRAQLDAVNAGAQPISAPWLQPSGERAVQLITSMLHNKKSLIESGVIHNRGVIRNLPYDCAVEVPLAIDASGAHAMFAGDLPTPIASLLTTQAGVQRMSVEAAVHASKQEALQALLIDPVVNSIGAAEKILDELWHVNEPYIRACV